MQTDSNRKPKGYRVKSRTIDVIRDRVNKLRELFGIDNPYVNIVKILDSLAAYGIIELFVVDDYSPLLRRDELGKTKPITKDGSLIPLIIIRESVYNGAVEQNGFHRFTIAHEIGHALMHTREMGFSRSTDHRLNDEWFRDSEWQANTFAGELLAYYKFITSKDTTKTLCERFHISSQSALLRLRSLKKRKEI